MWLYASHLFLWWQPLRPSSPLQFDKCFCLHVVRGYATLVGFKHTEILKVACCKHLSQADFVVPLPCCFTILVVGYSLIVWPLVFFLLCSHISAITFVKTELSLKMIRTIWDAHSQQPKVINSIMAQFNFLLGSALVLSHCLTLCCLKPPPLQPRDDTKCQHRVSPPALFAAGQNLHPPP